MIPTFPRFKKLELSDKKEIENFTKKFPPYSDYNFTSMWCYNTEDKMRLSWLNGNLVVRFQDYLTSDLFYSFLGTEKVPETARVLLDFSKKKGLPPVLKLIPEVTVQANKKLPELFIVKEDRDNFDYIYDVEKLIKLNGKKLRAKKNFFNRFKKKYPEYTSCLLNLKKDITQKEMINLFFLWKFKKKEECLNVKNELKSLNKLIKKSGYFKLVSLGIYLQKKIAGFLITEKIHNHCGMIHFEKADTSYIGIYSYIMQLTAKYLQRHGCSYLNFQQDLGIPNLRKAKKSWNQIKFLQKYYIS